MREVVIFLVKLEDQRLDWNPEMLGECFLEVDQFEIDPVAVVQRVDLIDAILEVDLVVVYDAGVRRSRIRDDVDVLEFQPGLLQAKADRAKRDSG